MRRYAGPVDGRSAVREIVRSDETGVVCEGEVVDPFWRTGRAVEGEGGVTEGIGERGLSAADIEGAVGPAVAEGEDVRGL